MRRELAVGLGVLALAAPAALAFDPAAENDNYSKGKERSLYDDGGANPRNQALQALTGTTSLAQALADDPSRSPADPCAAGAFTCQGDTRVYDSAGRDEAIVAIHYVNRNGATISGHLWAPLARKGRRRRPMPAVVFHEGDLAPEQVYWWDAQELARHGYLVLSFDTQGHGQSDTYGTGADHDRHVDIQEQASCDCEDEAADQDAYEQAEDALAFLLSSRRHPYLPSRPAGRDRQRAQAAAHAVDAFDPLRPLVDARELGLAGHSRGADAVSVVGTRDRRIKALVAWDNLLPSAKPGEVAGHPGLPAAPRVPALGMSGDYYIGDPPYTADPDPQAKDVAFLQYRRAHVDAMELIVRGGTHFEWSYAPPLPATLRGIDMAAWYTRAWFDKYLKHQRSADARLLTDRWRQDGPGAAIDPRHDGNLFSFYYRSRLAIHVGRRAQRCDDLRSGCRRLVPRRRDGFSGDYSYLPPG